MEGSVGSAKKGKDEQSWRGFKPGAWSGTIDVRDFIVRNATPYLGDETFLTGPSKRTLAVWAKLQPYFKDEQKKGVLAVDAKTPSTLLAHKAGYAVRAHFSCAYGRAKAGAQVAARRLSGGPSSAGYQYSSSSSSYSSSAAISRLATASRISLTA